MKVAVLQQFLRSLVVPLKETGTSVKVVTDLERTCENLEPFHDREFADLADFLQRAKTYEEQGNWGTPKRSPAKKAAKLPPQSIPDVVERLRKLPKDADIDAEISALQSLTIPQLRNVVDALGIAGGFRKKDEGVTKIRNHLIGAGKSVAPPVAQSSSEKLDRIVETLMALKAKAESPDAPFDAIEDELRSLGSLMDAREAHAAARALGVVRTLTTRADSLEEIRRKVLEVKLARESIEY